MRNTPTFMLPCRSGTGHSAPQRELPLPCDAKPTWAVVKIRSRDSGRGFLESMYALEPMMVGVELCSRPDEDILKVVVI